FREIQSLGTAEERDQESRATKLRLNRLLRKHLHRFDLSGIGGVNDFQVGAYRGFSVDADGERDLWILFDQFYQLSLEFLRRDALLAEIKVRLFSDGHDGRGIRHACRRLLLRLGQRQFHGWLVAERRAYHHENQQHNQNVDQRNDDDRRW